MCDPRSSHCGAAEMHPTNIHEDVDLIPGLAQWVRDLAVAMSCGVGRRCSSDPKLPGLCVGRPQKELEVQSSNIPTHKDLHAFFFSEQIANNS